ncbi:MAG: hypothetical protein ACJ8GO_12180 [Ramlibacter sp.]
MTRSVRPSRVLLLGAGFTAAGGMPLTADLLVRAYEVARRRPWHGHDGRPAATGLAEWLVQVLDWYYPLAGIDHAMLQAGHVPGQVVLEDFLSFVGARASMGYATEQDVDGQGTRFVDTIRACLAVAVADQQARALPQLPPHFLQFARLAGDAQLVTFNWNTVIEHLWQLVGQPPARLAKVHGSIDWFPLEGASVPLQPLGEHLPGIGRASDPAAAYAAGMVPCVVIPSFDKSLQLLPFERLWQQPWAALPGCGELVVVGYSIRPDDFHSRAVLYPQLVRQSRTAGLRVKVVDLAPTAEERDRVRARFAGVVGCSFFFDGFTAGALDFIFDG